MIFEELAKVDAGYAITFVTSFVALRNVILAGTREQGQYFADKVAPGAFAGFALTDRMPVLIRLPCARLQ